MIPRDSLRCALVLALVTGMLFSQEPTPKAEKAPPFTLIKELPRRASVNQGNTGTCWCFATASFLETEVERTTGQVVDLSEMFIVRHSILAKAREYVARKGANTFGEGGLSHDVIAMAKEYGLVPLSAYPGRHADDKFYDHSELFRLLTAVVKAVVEHRGKPSKHMDAAILGIVDAYLGPVPSTIEVDGRKMTPKEYMADVLKLQPDAYVEIMSYSYSPFGEKAKLTVPDNWMHFDQYLNVPIDEFMEKLRGSIERGFSVAVDIDVSEPGFRSGQGLAQLTKEQEVEGAISQEVRDKMFTDKATTDDHLMHIVGLAKDEGGRIWYLTKDSGGPKRGPFGGHTYISENYLRAKALGFMVHKDALVKP